MLESELFDLLENTADAAYSVTADGVICSWNRGAERLFGYSPEEAVQRRVDDLLDARDSLGTPALAGGRDAPARNWTAESERIPSFDLEVRARDGSRLWVSVSTLVFDNGRTGRRLFVRIAHDITHRRRKEELLEKMLGAAREVVSLGDGAVDHSPVENLSEQELRILRLLADGLNAATITDRLRISPQTLRNHLHHINQKLRTHNRLEAVTHARKRGLI